MQKSLRRIAKVVFMRANAHRGLLGCLLGGLVFSAATALPTAAELINDPYVLDFADGAGSVAVNLPANTGVPVVFDLSYGSWSISFRTKIVRLF